MRYLNGNPLALPWTMIIDRAIDLNTRRYNGCNHNIVLRGWPNAIPNIPHLHKTPVRLAQQDFAVHDEGKIVSCSMSQTMDTQTGPPPADSRINGIIFPPFITQKRVDELKDWPLLPDDVYVVSYPRSGTTWTQQIVSPRKWPSEFGSAMPDYRRPRFNSSTTDHHCAVHRVQL
jgi:hypothetical protein